MDRRPRVAVIGAGVSGLTAAYSLRRALGDDVHLDVFARDDRPGGALRTRTVGGTSVDVGAEAFIVRRAEARDLITELGLADQIVSPGIMRPAVWSGGALHRLPSPALMGIPAESSAMRGLLDDAGLERLATEPRRRLDWVRGAEPTVGGLVADRFGDEVVARAVDPMLGGVYSARARDIGLREAIPALAAALDDGAPSLTAAVQDVVGRGTGSGPVFGALRGGYRTLVDALVEASRSVMHIGVTVDSVEPAGRGYELVADWTGDLRYDAVLVAAPVWRAADLLAAAAPRAADAFGAVDAAGSAVVAFAVDPDSPLPEYSGVLVATDSGLSVKAITLSSRKWPHLAASRGADGRPSTLRTSVGRLGEPVIADDAELVRRAGADLATVFGAAGLPEPDVLDAVVQRWPEGLPHYGPGHLAAMADATAALPNGLAVAGSGYRGVGVPACIGTARDAASRIVAHLHQNT
ncbi:protoporphyrinogen oxidase [Gordonia zhaorongruii]|uniref:protoporphyrinogen oxidase n=1 Tax=Gordonia zhaorongruii TaxID=2597659 RepID=UPI00117D15A8|nr:protoporphyrinogen oxidase [Gordonia zhaorongruii]